MSSQRANNATPLAGRGPLLWLHFAAALLAVVDFMVFHVAAVALTIAIYFGIPMLDDTIARDSQNWNWLAILRIVSPTVTIPGGAVTVLSTYFYARRIQEIEKEKQAAESARQEAIKGQQEEVRLEAEKGQQEEARRREEEARLRLEAEAEARLLRAQLEQANASQRLSNQDANESE